MTGGLPSLRHDCPRILRGGRHGSWAECRCGWTSAVMTTAGGATIAWANHYSDTLREVRDA